MKFKLLIIYYFFVSLLLSSFSPLFSQKETDILLWKAVQDGNIHKTDSLISAGADVNIRNEDGWTPLFVAAYYGLGDITELLIHSGAEINAKDKEDKTPLFIAVENKDRKTAGLLLEAGAGTNYAANVSKIYCLDYENWIDKKDGNYYPLHAAVICEDLEMVKLLLEYGADVNQGTKKGWTPAMLAAAWNAPEIFYELYFHNADLRIRNEDGMIAKDIAVSNEYEEIVSFIKDPGPVIRERMAHTPVLTTSFGHSDVIIAVCYSPDGKYVITGSLDNTIKLWDTGLGKVIRTFTGHRESITAVTCDFNTKLMVSADNQIVKLWNLEAGTEIGSFAEPEITKLALSEDNKYILAGTESRKLFLWDVEKSERIREFKGCQSEIRAVAFSHDNNYFIAGNADSSIILWNINNSREIRTFTGHSDMVLSVAFSSDDKYLISGSQDQTIRLWEVEDGQLVNEFKGHSGGVFSVAFSSDNKYIISGSYDKTVKIWNVGKGNIYRELPGSDNPVLNPVFAGNDNYMISGSSDNILKIWDIRTLYEIHTLFLGQRSALNPIALKFENRYLVSGVLSNNIKIWNIEERNRINNLPIDISELSSFSLGVDNNLLITEDKDGIISLWDPELGNKIRNLPMTVSFDESIAFSSNNEHLILGSSDSVKILDIKSGKEIFKYGEEWGSFYCWTLSSDEKFVAAVDGFRGITLLDIEQGKPIRTFDPEPLAYVTRKFFILEVINTWSTTDINSLAFSSDNKYIAVGLSDNTVRIWDIGNTFNDSEIQILQGHTGDIRLVDFSSDNRYVISAVDDNTIKIWETARGKEVATLISVGDAGWIVTTPEGLFDASPDAMKYIYYVQGLEIFELDQLKDRYYEPGLLQKLLGYNDEPIRDVSEMGKLDLYPGIVLNQPGAENGRLNITLTNRGGGIGEVKIFINGKEIVRDARGANPDPDAEKMNITTDIKDHPYLKPGTDNLIEVKAYNADGYLVSRGVKVLYNPGVTDKTEVPRLYIVASGVSDYAGKDIDLKYAAKDAEDMARALEIGAKRLFGTDRTFTYLLTTSQGNENLQPTRANLTQTFEEISRTANSSDILAVYLSGHGINWGGQDGDFYYLTKDAYTANADAYNDPAIREYSTLSSEEMVELIKKIPALKQILIIDACASGKMVENLMTQRDISSSTLRALDRMKDRTGMHIITGCTADAVSYETSRYGQGLLTYSLLEGIKGGALREDRFVDVNLLFQNSRERVPELAEGIGGIQKPEIFSPFGAESFDIGELNMEDKQNIPLAKVKPVFVRSVFQDENELEDVLGLSKLIDDTLNEISLKGNGKSIIYVNTREFPEAYKLSGLYKQESGLIILKMKLRSDGASESYTITGENTDELKRKILDKINSIDFN